MILIIIVILNSIYNFDTVVAITTG